MKKVSLLLLLICLSASGAYCGEAYRFHITFTDKNKSHYSLDKPLMFISKKALDRRTHQHLSLDSTDLPVSNFYLEKVKKSGATIAAVSKWNNSALITLDDSSKIANIKSLPFIKSTCFVWKGNVVPKYSTVDTMSIRHRQDSDYYGPAAAQIKIHNGQLLHQAGYRGDGMTIAVVDGGFMNVDKIPLLDSVHILGVHNFVRPTYSIYKEQSHGTRVLSCMATNKPYEMVGTAPNASYWLLVSEDFYSETPAEEDFWAAAVEFADSVGADVINSSLGYYKFDNHSDDILYRQLNGNYSLISQTASMLADKGIVLVNSAGNSGMDSWKKISIPADADNILTVGAVDTEGRLAPFSSIGNAADNRIKPDIVAVGVNSVIARPNGKGTERGNGTSFASPIMCGLVACLWQACPQLTAKQLIDLIRKNGDRNAYPDNIYGYGIPDMWKALLSVHPEKAQNGR
jgi:subtilisin family serine protease